jgi:chromosome segregation ATPase
VDQNVDHGGSDMRVYAPLDDPTVEELDQAATKKGISRAQFLINAVESYLHQPEPSAEKLDQLRIKLDQKDSELDQQKIKLDQANSEMDQLRIKLDQSNTEATDIKNELDHVKSKHKQAISEATQRWEELKGYKSEVTKLKKQLEESSATTQQIKDELLRRQSETDQLAKTREELAVARTEVDKLKEAMKVRDDDVAWLRGHVAQLTQQLALPPSQEEARAKSWWQFWK